MNRDAETPAVIDVIIVHFHASKLVSDAVAALQRDAQTTGIPLNILVADNGSTSDERAHLQSLAIQYLDSGRNAGYAGAVNLAFPATKAEVVVLMNEDVNVLPGCLRALHEALLDGAAIAGPQFYWDDDCTFLLPSTEERTRANERCKVSGQRDETRLARARTRWRTHARRHWRATRPLPTTSLSGALLSFRRSTWTTIGPFDEGFALYFEEDDWLLRAARANLMTLYVPDAKAVHRHNTHPAQHAARSQWEAASFRRFGDRYYGERFMNRLSIAAGRKRVVPHWKKLRTGNWNDIRIEVPGDCRWPLWVELSPSPLGFPAATARVDESAITQWRLPPLTGLDFLETFYLQLVDDGGRELDGYCVQRAPAR